MDEEVMNELALFAGGGGGLLGSALLGWTTVGAVEISPFCREVLLRRQADGLLPLFPVWDDIRTFSGKPWRGKVDIVTAGFPCQPWSCAGQQKGEADDRNLWPDTIRVIREVGPRFALLENVPGLLAHEYFGTILGELAEAGFDAEWCVLGADDVGAPHRRKRLWILAYPNGSGLERQREVTSGAGEEKPEPCFPCWWDQDSADVGNPDISSEITHPAQGGSRDSTGESSQGPTQPRLGGVVDELAAGMDSAGAVVGGEFQPMVPRVATGIKHRVDRLRVIGNGQVPLAVVAAWRLLGAR